MHSHKLLERKGLSPRVRGNRYRMNLKKADRRSIPACAGEPSSLGIPFSQ